MSEQRQHEHVMTKAANKALGRYVRALADRMGLMDWHFIVERTTVHPDTEAFATVRITGGRRRALIKFAADILTLEPAEQREVVVHELVHCHLEQIATVYKQLFTQLGTHSYEVIESWYREAVEQATDAIATAWARSLPLPEKDVPAGERVAAIRHDQPKDEPPDAG